MENNTSFEADQCILHYEQQQLLQSPHKTSSEFLIAYEAEICHGVKRSSKGSRRTMPTTLLKANPSNFRALVQKYTGRSSGRRKGPVTLDFRSPTSVSKEVIFPNSDLQNYDCATYMHVGYGETHVTCEQEGNEGVSYPMGQLSHDYGVCGGYDEGDLVREYLENSSFNGVNCDGFYHDKVLLEEFMRDLDF